MTLHSMAPLDVHWGGLSSKISCIEPVPCYSCVSCSTASRQSPKTEFMFRSPVSARQVVCMWLGRCINTSYTHTHIKAAIHARHPSPATQWCSAFLPKSVCHSYTPYRVSYVWESRKGLTLRARKWGHRSKCHDLPGATQNTNGDCETFRATGVATVIAISCRDASPPTWPIFPSPTTARDDAKNRRDN